MKKNGFTITELMTVIVVLGILMTFASTSVITVINRVNEKDYDKLITEIEVAATNYAEETNKNLFFVADLIQTGAIDSKDDKIISPKNRNETLNCYPIEVIYENGTYEATIIEENYIENESCDTTRLKSSSNNLQIQATKDEHDPNKYYINVRWASDFDLIITSNTGFYEIIKSTSDSIEKEKTYSINLKENVHAVYTATLRLKDTNIVKSKSITINE